MSKIVQLCKTLDDFDLRISHVNLLYFRRMGNNYYNTQIKGDCYFIKYEKCMHKYFPSDFLRSLTILRKVKSHWYIDVIPSQSSGIWIANTIPS